MDKSEERLQQMVEEGFDSYHFVERTVTGWTGGAAAKSETVASRPTSEDSGIYRLLSGSFLYGHGVRSGLLLLERLQCGVSERIIMKQFRLSINNIIS